MGGKRINFIAGVAAGAGLTALLMKRQQQSPRNVGVRGIGPEVTGLAQDTADSSAKVLDVLPPACPADPAEARHPERPYRLLQGPQVEPEAGYWTEGPRPLPHVVPIAQVRELVETEGSDYYVPPFPTDREGLEWEIAELRYLQNRRNNSSAIIGSFPTTPPDSVHPIYRETRRAPISDFIQLHSPPFGAIFNIGDNFQYLVENVNQQQLRRNIPNPGDPRTTVVSTGRELARMFENETPGLYHRHALSYLFYKRGEISPPRQARVWMALDVTIYSALLAAWYYKWASERFSYRQRPYEYDQNQNFRVLFDDIVGDAGRFDKCPRTMPCPSPGTPRHPAFPSGHSTFSAAASEILAYFFPEERTQWDNLANNIGTARLWAGVHWRSDHIAGQRIGRAVARRVIEQLQGDCVPRLDQTLNRIPSFEEVKEQATRRRNQEHCDPRQDQLPTQRRTPFNDCEESIRVF